MYCPPTWGNRDASSAHTNAPISATTPPSVQTSRMSTGSLTTRATLDGFAKIPTPMMPPATTTTESKRPSSRLKPVTQQSCPRRLTQNSRKPQGKVWSACSAGSAFLRVSLRRRIPLHRRRHVGRREARHHLVAHHELIEGGG